MPLKAEKTVFVLKWKITTTQQENLSDKMDINQVTFLRKFLDFKDFIVIFLKQIKSKFKTTKKNK